MYGIMRKIFKTGIVSEKNTMDTDESVLLISKLNVSVAKIFGKSLAIRHVDAGSCNGCELEIHALNNPFYNIQGCGIHFVASPRHADLLLVTGPVSRHMMVALKKTYDAMPHPKWVIATGDCACNGGVFGETYATVGSVNDIIPVDIMLFGCPPTPQAVLQGIFTLVQKRS